MSTTTHRPPDVSLMLQTMLGQQPVGDMVVPVTNAELAIRQTQALDRRATGIVNDAREVGVDVEYLGAQPLFTAPRLYEADPNDWIIGPANGKSDLVVPKREQTILKALTAEDIDFPLIYVAHEIPKAKTRTIVKAAAAPHTEIEAEHAQELVGPVPEPAEAVQLHEKLGDHTQQVMRGLRRTAIAGGVVVAGLAAAPIVIAGAALAGLAQLDPIIIGAVPAGEPREGQMAGWFVLCRWDW
jgi:hypothetical protein